MTRMKNLVSPLYFPTQVTKPETHRATRTTATPAVSSVLTPPHQLPVYLSRLPFHLNQDPLGSITSQRSCAGLPHPEPRRMTILQLPCHQPQSIHTRASLPPALIHPQGEEGPPVGLGPVTRKLTIISRRRTISRVMLEIHGTTDLPRLKNNKCSSLRSYVSGGPHHLGRPPH